MRVAIAAWFALILREKGMTRLGVAYVLGIFFSSIVLGWHYVADGVGGIVIAHLADRLAQSWLHRRAAGSPLVAQPVAAPN
jgi:hypothetical protein